MVDGRTNERAFNFALSSVLRRKNPRWANDLNAEQTQVIRGKLSHAPDIVLSLRGCPPVVIETEFSPASTVHTDAASRLGDVLANSESPIEHSIAICVPAELRQAKQHDLEDAIERSAFQYCVYSSENGTNQRWPSSGWLDGSINDVANCVECVTLTESLLARTTDILERGVKYAAIILSDTSMERQRVIGNLLCQEPGEQTNRMACAIIANSMIFHSCVEGRHHIPVMESLKDELGNMSKPNTVSCWRWIISAVNFWPIFRIAADLLQEIPTKQAIQILNRLYSMSASLSDVGVTGLTDISGRMFQKLITDRKFLATFYTLPVSATFLSELAASRLKIDWKDSNSVTELEIADFACGTGTLIGSLYHSILARYRRAGSDDREIHAKMLERAVYAFDILPSATHLTASTLSNLHPAITFGTTRIVTMPYGKDQSSVTYIGSLELLKDEQATSLLSLGRSQLFGIQADNTALPTRGPIELNSEIDHDVDMPHDSLDLIVMNPPFTRPTNHKLTDVPIPSFAGFNTSSQEQKAMGAKLKNLRKKIEKPVGNGYAGLASDFIDLAHVKLKEGGIMGLVLPGAFAAGSSWEKTRQLLAADYSDITVVSITSTGEKDVAFSADTGMAEVLVVATKKSRSLAKRTKQQQDEESPSFRYVNLKNRPCNHVEAYELARFIHQRQSESNSGNIVIGSEDLYGNFINSPKFESGCVALSEPNLAKFMMLLSQSKLLSVRTNEKFRIPITNISALGNVGAGHRSLVYQNAPFKKASLTKDSIPTYPTLWSHQTDRERYFFVKPDCQMQVRSGKEKQAAQLWLKNASRLHINLDFRLNSQSLAACMTNEKTLGGTAWPNFVTADHTTEKAVMLWLNSTLGLMCHWWNGNRQHIGRSRISVTTLPNLLVFDPRGLEKKAQEKINDLFEKFCNVRFLPANESYRDQSRIALDKALLEELLCVPQNVVEEFKVVRNQWCAEPRVHGGKSTSPQS